MSDTNNTASENSPQQSLPDRTLALIKQAQDLITGLRDEIKTANEKAENYEADYNASNTFSDQIIEKLATIRVGGDFIIPPHLVDNYREALNTKEGQADLMNQIVDLLKNEDDNKTASTLGSAAADPNPYGDDNTTSSGFGALPSRIRM